jgi:insertion element IS1 protein InsB
VNQAVLQALPPEQAEVEIGRADQLAHRRGLASELDAMWSYVGKKAEPRWLWHAIDHHSGHMLASVFGRRQEAVFLQLQTLLEPFGITRFYTDGGRTSGTLTQSTTSLASSTRRKSRANIAIDGPGSSGLSAAPYVFPKRRQCTLW